MKLNIAELSGFVALVCKSGRTALSHTSYKDSRISSLLAQREEVKLVTTTLQGNSHFWKEKAIEVLFRDWWRHR